jgi:hypothetical protein
MMKFNPYRLVITTGMCDPSISVSDIQSGPLLSNHGPCVRSTIQQQSIISYVPNDSAKVGLFSALNTPTINVSVFAHFAIKILRMV